MTAFIGIKFRLRRLPSGIPDGIVVLNIEILPVVIIGNTVVAITCDTEKLCILIEGVTASGVGNQAEEVIAAEIVDPGKRRFRCGDDIFHGGIVKVTVVHRSISSLD